jgi:hypothetical protein
MENTRFIAANGREVIKIVTDAGATGYIDASVPLNAIVALHRRLGAYLRRPLAHSRRILRQSRRRKFSPLRTVERRRRRGPSSSLPRRPRPLIARR